MDKPVRSNLPICTTELENWIFGCSSTLNKSWKQKNSVMLLFLMTHVTRCIETNTFSTVAVLQGDTLTISPPQFTSHSHLLNLPTAFRFSKETATTILQRWGDSRSWWPSTSEYSQRGGLPLASAWGWRSSAASCQVRTQAPTCKTADGYLGFNSTCIFWVLCGMYSVCVCVCVLKCMEYGG